MARPLAPARPRLPDAGAVDYGDPQAVKRYMQSLVGALTTALEQRAPTHSAIPNRLLVSPNGTAYNMTVDDTGTVTTTKLKDPLP
jgi:hypothetical protein